jgi:hypothetical protein
MYNLNLLYLGFKFLWEYYFLEILTFVSMKLLVKCYVLFEVYSIFNFQLIIKHNYWENYYIDLKILDYLIFINQTIIEFIKL